MVTAFLTNKVAGQEVKRVNKASRDDNLLIQNGNQSGREVNTEHSHLFLQRPNHDEFL